MAQATTRRAAAGRIVVKARRENEGGGSFVITGDRCDDETRQRVWVGLKGDRA